MIRTYSWQLYLNAGSFLHGGYTPSTARADSAPGHLEEDRAGRAFAAHYYQVSLAYCCRKTCLCRVGCRQMRELLILKGRHVSISGGTGDSIKATSMRPHHASDILKNYISSFEKEEAV